MDPEHLQRNVFQQQPRIERSFNSIEQPSSSSGNGLQSTNVQTPAGRRHRIASRQRSDNESNLLQLKATMSQPQIINP